MNENVKHVTDASFDSEVLKAGTPVLVDYWAEWCGPCKMIAPILDEVAKDYAGRVTVAKLDVDANPGTPAKYGIRGIPTLILFKGDRKSTRLNSSHRCISYAVFCLKKKKII